MGRTIEQVQLYEQERQALAMLVQAQFQVIMVRGLQVAVAEREAEAHDEYVRSLEREHENAEHRAEDWFTKHNVQMARAQEEERRNSELRQSNGVLRQELAELQAIVREGSSNQPDKYAKLIELCLDGRLVDVDDDRKQLFSSDAELAIVEEVLRLKGGA